ncbi:TetR/AcrR family transcriptional regulator [Mycolicibacterium sp. ELW1]|uniref:TetR/AcrR family transcriptional regulator n=1 Tax=Mycobacteriaceae TaxID=1762 RepID=UPI0011EF660E|nr:TetR/AcrR family transcriptional regulator [Mycobacterium sp. ELW1]QEN12946.1 TetR/AcrR family transcriptional regulator [Mycobacterium sp. ELW1]
MSELVLPTTTPSPSPVVFSSDEPTASAIILAGVAEFSTRGFHGTSVRDIASAAAVSVGTLYNHFGSKHELLSTIMNRGMDDLLTKTEDALFHAGADPADHLRAIVGVHVGVHAHAPRESLIGNSELRSLEPAVLSLIVAKRDAQQRMFYRVIENGVARGYFTTSTARDTARFVITACTAVASWFRLDGQLQVDEIVARYQDIALRAVGYREQD